ncbi:hypothetical protein FACS189434_07840 [Bacteroidia bacterium]|nr:hypothetical protein FACS189434_07840 [Bacteroidia bacterium]
MYLGEIEEMERYGFSLEGENAKWIGLEFETVICTKKGFRSCEFYFEKDKTHDFIPREDVERFIFKL